MIIQNLNNKIMLKKDSVSFVENPIIAKLMLEYDYKTSPKNNNSNFDLDMPIINLGISSLKFLKEEITDRVSKKTCEATKKVATKIYEQAEIKKTYNDIVSTYVSKYTTYEPTYTADSKISKKSVANNIMKSIVKVPLAIVSFLSDTTMAIGSFFKQKFRDIKYEYNSSRSYKKMMKELDYLNYQRQVDALLYKYKSMFYNYKAKPDFTYYENVLTNSLSLKELKKVIDKLNSDIRRQENIAQLAKMIRNGEGGNNPKPPQKRLTCDLMEIDPPKKLIKTKQQYIELLTMYLYRYKENSKRVQEPLCDFKDIVKNYLKYAISSLKEIYNLPNETRAKICKGLFIKTKHLERIPKLGIIPKGARVYEQWILSDAIIEQFESIMHEHVVDGIHPIIKKYTSQFSLIEDFVNQHREKFDRKTQIYSDKVLKAIQKLKMKRFDVYAKEYNAFATGGCNIKNAINNVKLKGGISMAIKTASTIAALCALL